MVNYRHGDLALISIDKLPQDLKKSDNNIIMKGSNNNPHSFRGGELYIKSVGEYVIGYLVAKNCVLFHKEHGKIIKGSSLKEAKIKNGIYELRCQIEHTNTSMKRVVD
jgi:hypothetical protein